MIQSHSIQHHRQCSGFHMCTLCDKTFSTACIKILWHKLSPALGIRYHIPIQYMVHENSNFISSPNVSRTQLRASKPYYIGISVEDIALTKKAHARTCLLLLNKYSSKFIFIQEIQP